MFEVTGNSIDPITLNVRRSVTALDESPNPEISYSVEVTAEGADAVAVRYATAPDRVFAALGLGAEDAKTVRQIGDACAHDGSDKPLKHDTIRQALNRTLFGQGRFALSDGQRDPLVEGVTDGCDKAVTAVTEGGCDVTRMYSVTPPVTPPGTSHPLVTPLAGWRDA